MIQVRDYATLRTLKDSDPVFSVMGVDMATRKVREYYAKVAYTDHTTMLTVKTPAQSIVCPTTHRFLTTTLAHPFVNVSEACLRWIRAIDLRAGMVIAVAPSGPMQAPNQWQGHYTLGNKITWSVISYLRTTNLFENYGISVMAGDNYILNDMLHRSYDSV